MFSVITQCETLIQNRDKFHALDRSNFRSKDWAEVSKIVNATCRNDEKAPKTQEQCRMKVDSLKKRYRQEKDKLAGNIPCKWPWFDMLDDLIGGSPKQSRVGSARRQARFLCSPPPGRPPSVVHTPYFGGVAISLSLLLSWLCLLFVTYVSVSLFS
jgi:hypothetical protein